MNEKPEALRLAEVLDLLAMDMKTPRQAAAELRRLYALNVELLEALREVAEWDAIGAFPRVHAVIAKVTGEAA